MSDADVKISALSTVSLAGGEIVPCVQGGVTKRFSAGTMAEQDAADFQPVDAQLTSLSGASANGVSLVTAADYAAMKALLDLEIGTDVQAYSAVLARAILALTKQDVTANSTTLAVNMASGWYVNLTLSSNVSVALNVSNPPASGALGKLTLQIASTGAYNISVWPGTTKWAGGTAPTITSGNGKTDTIILTTIDGGTNWRGHIAGQNFS